MSHDIQVPVMCHPFPFLHVLLAKGLDPSIDVDFVTPYTTCIIADGIYYGMFTIDELKATFLAHVNAFTGVDGTPANIASGSMYGGYVERIFQKLAAANIDPSAIDYIIDLLSQEWKPGYKPPA